MPLTQEQRMQISRKIVSIPDENVAIDESKASIEPEKIKAFNLDQGNSQFFNDKNAIINIFQAEIEVLDGLGRTRILEQDMIDSANKKLANVFFPNDSALIVPSLGSSFWTQLQPFILGYGIGKTRNEGYLTIIDEPDKILAVNTKVSNITAAYTHIQRTTGQICTAGMPTDTIASSPAIQNELDILVNRVNDWKSFLTYIQTLIYLTDPNSGRAAQAQAAFNLINTTKTAIDVWLAYPDFDTSHGQTTCSGFNSYNPNSLAQTKLRNDSLAYLASVISTRQTNAANRVSEISGYLGTVTQNVATGEFTSLTGLYGARAGFIELRLNLLTGSLSVFKNLERSSGSLNSIKTSNNVAKDTYLSVMNSQKFAAPGNGTNFVDLTSSNGFNPGQQVYIVSDSQPELSATIRNIIGNKMEISIPIPQTYRESEYARIYREL